MDVASDGLNRAHASKLRLVKDMRERSALRELSDAEARRRIACQAMEQATQDLANAEQHQAGLEAELYRQLASVEGLSVAELDRRYHRAIERITGDIASKRRRLDEVRAAQKQAEADVSDARTLWVKCSEATQKWRQIEGDMARAADAHSQAAAEIEADDDALVRHRSRPATQPSGSQ